MITVRQLTKRYGRTTAVDGISFDVARGSVVGFLGPNGAGKTTTLRILAGCLAPTAGAVTVGGFDVLRESLEVRRRIGYLPENAPLYPEMRVTEYLGYRGRLKGVYGRRLKVRVADVVEACSLGEVRKRIIGQLSKGFRQRVGFADSLVHEPELLILDEPTIGLDPNQIRQIRTLIKGLAGRHTVLLSSHILSEVEMTCEHVLIIKNGSIAASDSPEKLVGLLKGNPQVVAEIRGPAEAVKPALADIDGITAVSHESHGEWGRYTCDCGKGADVREDIHALVTGSGWVLRELNTEKRNLEDVFVSMMTEEKES